MQSLGSIPEQGQLAVVRQRRYVVTDVRSGVRGGQIAEQPQHLVSLTSIEDDALGEELQVIWEIEPGARAFEKMELPEPKGFDQPAHLEAFLDAVRWGAASIADTRQLQSPFRSGIEIESYQLDPVVRAIQMPRVNLLIADDVGLGKTDHRLVQRCLRLLRAEAWAPTGHQKIHRVTVRTVPRAALRAPAVPPALSTSSLRTSPPAGLPSRNAWTPASRRQERPPGAQPAPGGARLRQFELVLVLRLDRSGRSVADCVDT
jgi:hypothetical protein